MPLRHMTWKTALSFLFFTIPFVVLLTLIVVGRVPLFSMAGVFMLLCGGFPVAGLAMLPAVSRRPGAGDGPNALQWCFLLLGAMLWCAAPIVGYLASSDWNSALGSETKAVPMWLLAVITWGVALLILVAGYRQWRRARSRSAED